jgi:hypothetical protein
LQIEADRDQGIEATGDHTAENNFDQRHVLSSLGGVIPAECRRIHPAAREPGSKYPPDSFVEGP